MNKRAFEVPTAAEDAAIARGIAADADTYEVPSEQIAGMRRLGRPPVAVPRPMLSMRVDAALLEKLRASGRGWQTRVHAALKEAVDSGRL
ncbi:MAG TPA: BrnA antitoxin family protein [Ottowia sp.]|uniref:BrnA antitoxin family protein n=1 Tax=Ottowia sp. TaxID=1898956 RepID=UPI002BB9500F|nr:BrnA antitoxin family protein [Ottowia sp.]HQD46809.1 BrnA antitoxin family protein [Ottowia sp.]